MKFLTHLCLVPVLCACFWAETAFAQTYFHPTAGIQNTYAGNCEVNVCGGVYVDDGGTGGNYSNGVNNVYRTFCPAAPNQCIRVTFTQFNLEAPDFFGDCYDYLAIGSGPTQNSPVIWQGCGATLPPPLTSTDPSGCLTMRFVSDGTVNAPGWRANITCVPCPGGGPSSTLSNDCPNAQYVCDNLQPINANSQGPGLTSEACVSGCAISENYSNWFILNVTAAGSTGFTITPTPVTADYDFSLYGPVTGGCGNLGAPIRCSYAANTGSTGMRSISPDLSEDVNGDGWVSSANLAIGTYYLLVNQWAYEPNSSFRLDFTPGGPGTQATIGLPPLSISSNSPVCSNQALQFTAPAVSGATYSWSGPGGWTSSQQNPTRNPPVAGTYSVFYTVNGCNSPSTSNINVVVNPAPTAAIAPATVTVCSGQSATLTASGGGTYAWSNSLGTNATVTVTPPTTTAYTVTVTSGGCTASVSRTVTVNASLAVSITPAAIAVCSGGSVTLTASGGATYQWSNSLGTNPIVTVTPAINTTYTVTATSGASCTGTASATVAVNPNPTAGIFPPNPTICNGAGTLLMGSGGGTYRWNTNQVSQNISVAPTTTTTYTLTVTDGNGCTASAQRIVTVNPNPLAIISPATATICTGGTLTLTASGGATYHWSTNENTAIITVAPVTTTTYTVTVTAATGCFDILSRTVTVTTAPVAAINPAAVSICTGTSTTLTASGGGTYAWSNSLGSAPSVSVAPTSNTNYTVTVTGIGGCTATATSSVTVNAGPIAAIAPAVAAVCNGTSITLTASGGTSYNWSNSLGTNASVTVSPASTTNYTVTVTDANNCTATATRTVNVGTIPAATILPVNAAVCPGASTTLTASGGATYQWDNGLGTNATVTVTPAAITTYNVTVTDASGCTATTSRTVTVNTAPPVAINPALISVCAGESATLTANGGNTYLWSNSLGTNPTVTVTPAATTTYSVTVTDVNSCTATTSATVTVNPLPVAAITPATVAICNGASTTLTASGGAGYDWSNGLGILPTVTVSPITTTTYTVTVTDAGICSATASAVVTVNPNPVAAIAPATASICAGGSTTLTASGGTTYVWDNGLGNAATVTVSPLVTTPYNVTVSDANSCTATTSGTVNVSPSITAAIAPSSVSVCSGASTTLTASGGSVFTWGNGLGTNASITVNPTTTTTYDVTVSDGSTCTATASATVTVNALPNAAINPAVVSICSGTNATLTASGGTSYQWDNSLGTNASVTVTPATTTTYNVTVTDANNCSATTSRTVTVNTNAVAVISPAVVAVCSGTSTTLTASGGTSYQWDNSLGTNAIVSFTPATSTRYNVTVTDANNCTATTSRAVTVNALPTIAIAPASVAICNGTNTTLTASGGATYQWDNGLGTNTNVTVSPITTTTYSVTGTDASACSATASATVAVNALPNAAVSPAAVAICTGTNTTLTASGGTSYQWDNSLGTNASVTVTPATATTYNVTVTDVNSCSATASGTVTVNTNPVAAISPALVAVCQGVSATLTASGGATYQWDNSLGTNATVSVTPAASTTYNVTVTDGNNCSATTSRAVTVNAIPAIAISPASIAICNGDNTTLTASGGATYQWDNALGTNATVNVNPANTITYSVTGTDANTCSATATATVTVNPLPIATISPASVSLCNGSSTTLTASGGVSYAWDNFEVTASITVAPPGTDTYTVTVTDGNNCTAVTSRTVFVNQNLVVDIAPAVVAVCAGGSATLTATGGTSYSWSTTEQTASITVTPLVTTTYSVTANDVNGCTGTASRDVTVNPNPVASIAPAVVTICEGTSATLTASGGTSYAWDNFEITPDITVSPIATDSYDVTVTDANGCTASTARTVTVNPNPVADITASSPAICVGGNTTLTATGGVSYAWDNFETTPSIIVSPLGTDTYSVTVTDGNNCTATASETVTVNPLPSVSITPLPASVCEGGSSTLTANGGVTYIWSDLTTGSSITVTPLTTVSYAVTGTDANNCTATSSTTINVNVNPTVTISPLNPIICGGQNATLTAFGAMNYAWSNSMSGTSITVSPFSTTTYSVTGTDGNSCFGSASTDVNVTQSITITPFVDDVSCNDGSDGGVNITVAGGQSPYTFTWSNGSRSQNISGVRANNYDVTVTDDIGCGSTTSAAVGEPDKILIAGMIDNPNCFGETNGSIDITVTGGISPYDYKWNDGPQSEDRLDLSSGNYSVIVTDANICDETSDFIVEEGAIIDINAAHEDPSCAGINDNGSISVNASGGAVPYSYTWSNGPTTETNSSLPPGNYSVTVSDDNGCTDSDSYTLTYKYQFSTDAGNGTTITVGQTVKLGYTLTGNAGTIASNTWTPDESLDCDDCENPDASPEVSTLYTITVTNEDGCLSTDTVRVNVVEEGQVVTPNAFTPNGDGNNDEFQIYGNLESIKTFEVQIFDRWGDKVFESTNPAFKWDGSYQGKLLRPDVYVFQVKLSTLNNSLVRVKKGSVTLFR